MSFLLNPDFWQKFTNSTITTPAHEIMLLLLIITLCLLIRWTRIGMLAAFIYVYRWGWLFMHQEFHSHHGALIVYYITGITVIVASIIAFLMRRE